MLEQEFEALRETYKDVPRSGTLEEIFARIDLETSPAEVEALTQQGRAVFADLAIGGLSEMFGPVGAESN